ncbi:ATPase [Cupriavidus basilensis]|uniref:ATPase n=1 Tax=Cupriavidus basilensis TaxID=68895 RepID=UPI0023E7851E|nr:ATPase [Cupriavidus basilensis]MDF3882707.1 ATPase [Cupriavidus basilensis]
MTTNTDTAVVATLDDAPLAAAADTLAASGPAIELADMAPGTGTSAGITDGADDGSLERELQEMDAAAETLRKEGLISLEEAAEKKAEVDNTRKRFRELKPEDRAAIIRRRREIGVQILTRQLAGAAVVPVAIKLNHTRLRPLFEQWWPFMNRMSINLQRFGSATYAKAELAAVEEYFERALSRMEDYVDEQLRVAEALRTQREAEMRAKNDIVFEPTVTLPSLSLTVEAYSRFSMRVLGVLAKFDRTMDQFDFMVWNGIRDQTDINDEVARFLRSFHPLGLRSYTTHLKLMTTVRGV